MSYHFKNSRASVRQDEPVYLTKFITTWVLPAPLQAKHGGEVIMEQIKKVGGLTTDKLPETVEQLHRFHKRRFAGSVVDTNIDLEMTFEVNLDENNVMYPYNIFKDWMRLIYDPHTGFQSLKRDYTGSLTIEVHNKVGDVVKNVFFPLLFPMAPANPFELEYNNEAIYELAMTFAGENPTDLIIGTP